MNISAITPFSVIDYPGKLSCIVFSSGCNMRCGYCHNKEFVLPHLIEKSIKNIIPEKIFFQFLQKRRNLLDGVSICGGEPTIQKDLESFCTKIKQLGFFVKLDTNGLNPHVLGQLIEKRVVDYIAMDIKSDIQNYSSLVGIDISQDSLLESIALLKEERIDYEFRTTCISPFHTQEMFDNIGRLLRGARKFYIQNYRSGENLDSFFFGIPFSQSELEKFKRIIKKYVVSVEIRI